MTTELKREDLKLPGEFGATKVAFVIRNVFNAVECNEMIDRTEAKGYVEAKVNIGNNQEVLMQDYRNSLRCIIDDDDLAAKIFDRISSFIPNTFRDNKLLGLNERLRFLKYHPGHFFAPHMDGRYVRPTGETSYMTVILYLNDGGAGSATRFLNKFDPSDYFDLIPETGLVLVFQHDLLHEGLKLEEGLKYVMRTDVMFEKDPILFPNSNDRSNSGGGDQSIAEEKTCVIS